VTSDKDQNDEVDGNLRSHQKRTVSPLWSEASIHQLSVERRQPPHFDAAVELLGLESLQLDRTQRKSTPHRRLRRTLVYGRAMRTQECVSKKQQ